MRISLLKLSFIISLLGILILLFLSNIEPPTASISDITNKHLNKKIKIQAQIKSIKNFEKYNFVLITVNDSTGEIDVIVNNFQKTLKNGQNIEITGKVIKYKNILQIQAEKIILL